MSESKPYLRFMWSHDSWVHRSITRTANRILRMVPLTVKYRIGAAMRRNKAPYRLIQNGSTVVQVGAPSDTLHAGRSRALYFSLFAGPAGKVVVVEPDTKSAEELRRVQQRLGVTNTEIVDRAAWAEP